MDKIMKPTNILLWVNNILPGNNRSTDAHLGNKISRNRTTETSCLMPESIPGLSTQSHDEITAHASKDNLYRNVTSMEELKTYIESQTPELTYTINFGWHLHPYMDYNSGDQLKNIVNVLKEFDNFHLLKWRFANGWDMYGLDEEKRIAWFKTQTQDINATNIIFHLVNVDTCNTYKKHFPTMDIKPYFIYYQRMMVKNKGLTFNANKEKRERYFICLNNYTKTHRSEIVDWIKWNKWQDKVDYSYISQNKTLGSEHSHDLTQFKSLKTFADGGQRNEHISHWQDTPPYFNFNRCYFYLVTETHFDKQAVSARMAVDSGTQDTTSVATFISEKTLKAMQFEIPFIIVGLPYSLKALRDLGYETFPELFDESYDTELDDKKRLALVKDAVQNLMNKPLDEVHNIVMQESVQAKILHNKHLFLENFRTGPWRQWEPLESLPLWFESEAGDGKWW